MSDRLAGVHDVLFTAAQRVRSLPASANSDHLSYAVKQVPSALEDLSSIRTHMRSDQWPPNPQRFASLAQASLIALRGQGGLGRVLNRKGHDVELEAAAKYAQRVTLDHKTWVREATFEIGRVAAVRDRVSVFRHALHDLRRRSADESVHFSVSEQLEGLASQDRRSERCIDHTRNVVIEQQEVIPLLEALRESLEALKNEPKNKTLRAQVRSDAQALMEFSRFGKDA